MTMLDVPVIGQATDYACGNTCLAAVVQFLGRRHTPEELGVLASTTEDGTDHAAMIAAAIGTGATVTANANGTLEELATFLHRGLPVIVGWWSMGASDRHFDEAWDLAERKQRDCGHFSVVRGLTSTGLLFMDPQDGDDDRTIGYCEKPAKAFESLWYDTDGPAYEKVIGWYMVLEYPE
jgi:predicted double-glycine peptidase